MNVHVSRRAVHLLALACLGLIVFGAARLERPVFSPAETPGPTGQVASAEPPARTFAPDRRLKPDNGLTRAHTALLRAEWELRRYRDPATGVIPRGIRALELEQAARMPARLGKNAATWTERGPFNVGGRTRGLAFDLDYDGAANRRVLAGGVSGGMYLSEDGGATWRLTSSLEEIASVTSLAQDPNDRNVWYHGTGEFSNSLRGVFYLGQGVYKSTDGGASWTRLPSLNAAGSLTQFDDPFDITWNVVVHPASSAALVAHLNGVSRSTDGGQSWSVQLSPETNAPGNAFYTDLALAPGGDVFASMSRNGSGNTRYGVFRSSNQGDSWTDITPPGLTADPHRIVLGAAPSSDGVVYAFVQKTGRASNTADHQLFRYNGTSWTDLSATLPRVTANDAQDKPPLAGELNSQGGYNMIVRVKPDDPNTVWVGGTNLYRSRDGGASWEQVGGYVSPYSFGLYENHHPDQHAMAFAPGDPNTLLSGHDGGLSITSDATESPQRWTSLNNGYITSQFYGVSIDPQGGDLVMGGTQDNGTWLTQQSDGGQPWASLLGGDGGFSAVAPGGGTLYGSFQNGEVLRIRPGPNGGSFSFVSPQTLPNPPFIAPLALDPNDARVLFLASGHAVSRNSNLDAIPDGNRDRTDQNWTQLTGSAVGSAQTHQVSALAVSTVPAGRLVFATSDGRNETKVIRVDSPETNGPGQDVTPPFGADGAVNVSSIGINPQNGDEMVVVASNYRVRSLWHTTDGGQTWTDVEGNLAGDDGPSVRWIAIQPIGAATTYVLATSTGVYTTETLAGSTTSWEQEGADVIGNVVVDMVATRSDGTAVAATHGRGMYSATLGGGGGQRAVASVGTDRVALGVQPGRQRSATVQLANTGGAALGFTASAACAQPGTPARPAPDAGMTALLTNPRTLALGGVRSGARPAMESIPAPRRAARAPERSLAAQSNTTLVLDDGDGDADGFIGPGTDNGGITYYNRFDVTSEFVFEGAEYFVRTAASTQNSVTVTLYDGSGNARTSGTVSIAPSPDGQWYTITSQPVTFAAGSSFFVEIVAPGGVDFPAGADTDAQTTGASFISGVFVDSPISDIEGFENGAWLIRAVGTQAGGGGGGQNQRPTANGSIRTPDGGPAVTGVPITFDASASSDPDGQIAAYLWSFGDGQSSAQAVAAHTYTAPGTYPVSIMVTDDQGARDTTSVDMVVEQGSGGGGGSDPCPLTVAPASGQVAAGGSQALTLTYDATGVAEGTYAATLSIGGNGGTFSVPVDVTVSTTVSTEEEAQAGRRAVLLPNRPNPFAGSTEVPVELREALHARVVVYDAIGRVVRVLADRRLPAGTTVLPWDGRGARGDLPSGVYFVRLQSADGSVTTTRRVLKL